jgi:acetyl esterase/lipase
VSLASGLVRYAPSIRRAHHQYATASATRAAMIALRAGPPTHQPPASLGWRTDVVAGVSPDGWPLYEVRPRGGRSAADLLFLHGGAYFREMRDWHWRFVERLVRAVKVTVLVPIYPLAPVGTADSIVPAVVGLARDVLRTPGRPVFLAGDSAGAGMALAVAQELATSDQRRLAGLLLISPWVDVACDDPGLAVRAPLDPWLQAPGLRAAGDAYRGSLRPDHPWVSPIHGDLRALPPLLVLSGTDDILTADAHRLATAVSTTGGELELVEAPRMIHDYALHPTPEGRAARAHIAAWLQERVAVGPAQ